MWTQAPPNIGREQGAKRAVTQALSADAELREWQRLMIAGRHDGDDGDPFGGCSALRPETQVTPLAYLRLYFCISNFIAPQGLRLLQRPPCPLEKRPLATFQCCVAFPSCAWLQHRQGR